MSLQTSIMGGLQWESTPIAATANTSYDVFTATDDETVASVLVVVNEASSAAKYTLNWYKSANTTSYPIFRSEVAADDTDVIESIPRRLASGDKITVTPDASCTLRVYAVVTRLPRTVQATRYER